MPPGGLVVRNWLLLGVRQVGVAALTFGGVLALTALLDPAQFAVYGYATLVFTIGIALGDLGVGASAMRSEAPGHRLSAGLGLQLLVWPPALALGVGAAFGIGGREVGTVSALLALAFMMVALQTLGTAVLERDQRFVAVGWVEVVQRAVFVITAVVLVAAVSHDGRLVAVAAGAGGLAGWIAAYRAARWHWRPTWPGRDLSVFRGFAAAWWQGRVANQLTYACYPLLGGLLFSARQVGLMIWALSVSAVPALAGALVARAVFPALARASAGERIAIYRRIFPGYLALSLPATTVLLVLARPIASVVFAHRWQPGVGLLRLECVTTALGLVLTPIVPLLYVTLRPAVVRNIMVWWAVGMWVLTAALAPFVGFYAASVASVATATVTLGVFEAVLRRQGHPGVLRLAARPFLVCAVCCAALVPLAPLVHGALGTALAFLGALALQVAILTALGGAGNPLAALRGAMRAGRG